MDTLPPPYRHPGHCRVSGCFSYEIAHSATLATLDTLFSRSFFLHGKSCVVVGMAFPSRATRVYARETLKVGWRGCLGWRRKVRMNVKNTPAMGTPEPKGKSRSRERLVLLRVKRRRL